MRYFTICLILLSFVFTGCAIKVAKPVDIAYLDSLPYREGEITAADRDKMWALFRQHDSEMTRVDPRYVPNKHTLDVMAMLPDTIAGAKSPGGITNYELNVSQRGLGYGKKYISLEPYKNITVYSYHSKLDYIPDGINSQQLQDAFEDSAYSIVAYAQEELEELDMGDVRIRNMPFMFAVFAMPQQQGLTYVFMTGFNNALVKVRYDHPFDPFTNDEATDEANMQHMVAVKDFMDELVRSLQAATGDVSEKSDEWL